jgi:hypothetical protein
VAAIHLAAGCSATLTALLLAAGAPPDARDLNKWSALHHAAWHGQCGAVQALLAAGANPNLKDRWSRTPLGCVSPGRHARASPAPPDASRSAALHLCSRLQEPESSATLTRFHSCTRRERSMERETGGGGATAQVGGVRQPQRIN